MKLTQSTGVFIQLVELRPLSRMTAISSFPKAALTEKPEHRRTPPCAAGAALFGKFLAPCRVGVTHTEPCIEIVSVRWSI